MVDRSPTNQDSPVSPRGSLGAEAFTVVVIGVGFLAALIVVAVFRTAPTELTALGVGIVFALALDPVLRATQRRLSCSRAVGTIIVGLGLTLLLGVAMFLVGPKAVDQGKTFAEELPATIEEFYGWPIIGQRLENGDAVGRVERLVDELPKRINAESITAAGDRLISNVFTISLVLVTAVAVLFDGEALVARARRTVPHHHREQADAIGRIVYQSMARYFAGSVSVALLNGLVLLTASLILGVPLAPLVGMWAALTNLIPQIGGFLGGSLFVVLALTQGPITGVIALVVFVVYQQLENHVIQPLVIGRAVNLSPPSTMLAALIGGAAAGVPGALVATPLLGAAKSVWLAALPPRANRSDQPADDEAS